MTKRPLFLCAGLHFAGSLCAGLLLAGLLCAGCIAAAAAETTFTQSTDWTREAAVAHARRHNAPELWQLERFGDDRASLAESSAESRDSLPFPAVAFPTPDYDLGGRECPGLTVGPVPVRGRLRASIAAVNLPLDLEALPEGKEWYEVLQCDPTMVIVARDPAASNDDAPLDNVDQWAISRSHPHYFFQGTCKGAAGEIDWAAIRMADGRRIGIVNGRVLDLDVGRVVLVRQLEDGALRIHQLTAELGPAHTSQHSARLGELLASEEAQEFWSAE